MKNLLPTQLFPTHRCRVCGAFWKIHLHTDSLEESDRWQLMSPACHKCCDNAFMGEQILPIMVEDARTYLQDSDIETQKDMSANKLLENKDWLLQVVDPIQCMRADGSTYTGEQIVLTSVQTAIDYTRFALTEIHGEAVIGEPESTMLDEFITTNCVSIADTKKPMQ